MNYHLHFPKIILLFIGILLAILIASCSSSTKPNTCSLTGNIVLVNDSGNLDLDPVDFSGVRIAIYPLAALDTTLVRLNTRYPTIGMKITQKTEFDHREYNPLSSSVTSAEGTFSISSIPEGVYNIAVYKEGWGFRYFCNFVIQQGSNSLNSEAENQNGNVQLYRDVVLSGYYTSGLYNYNSRHHVVIEDDVFFLEGSDVTFAPATVIRVNPYKKITFLGSVQMQGESDSLITITSNDGIYQNAKVVPQRFDRLSFNPGSQIVNTWLEYINLRYCDTGLVFNINSAIRNSVIACFNNAVSVSGSNDARVEFSISNCILTLDSSSSNYSLTMYALSQSQVEKNIFVESQNGAGCINTTGLTMSNNFFNNNKVGVSLNQGVTATISHNDFDIQESCIKTDLDIQSNITYNNFTSHTGLTYETYRNIGTAMYNNYYCSYRAVVYISLSAGYGGLMATNNWWGTTDEERIQELIYDKNDYNSSHPSYDAFCFVTYVPYRTSKQQNAGIQP